MSYVSYIKHCEHSECDALQNEQYYYHIYTLLHTLSHQFAQS